MFASDSQFQNNKGSEICDLCNPNCPKPDLDPSSDTRKLCWNATTCQNTCVKRCGERGCNSADECCSENCLGGCYDNVDDCVVCKNLTYWNGTDWKCLDSCPSHTFKVRIRCDNARTPRIQRFLFCFASSTTIGAALQHRSVAS